MNNKADWEDWDISNLTAEQARCIVQEETYRFEIEEENVIDTSRWSICYKTVIKDLKTGKFHIANYRRGATEQQDESPYESDGDGISMPEVIKVPIESYKWKQV